VNPNQPKSRDELGNIPRMSAERDGLVERRKTPRPPAKSGGGVSRILAIVILVMLAGAIYFLWVEYQNMQRTVAQADSRITALEAQLASTGDEMTQSDAAVRVQLSGLDKEVRRLEQNRRNDKAILQKHDKSVKNLTTRSAQNKKTAETLQQQMTAQAAELDELLELVDNVNFAQEAKKLQQAMAQLQATNDEVGVLGKRVSETEEWLSAVDAFRQQVNARLSVLEGTGRSNPTLQ